MCSDFRDRRLISGLTLAVAFVSSASAQTISRLAGEYVCVYGCRLTDANPTIEVRGEKADCMNEYGGLFKGTTIGTDGVACFRKTGRLSSDGLTIVWSDGVVWKRRAK